VEVEELPFSPLLDQRFCAFTDISSALFKQHGLRSDNRQTWVAVCAFLSPQIFATCLMCNFDIWGLAAPYSFCSIVSAFILVSSFTVNVCSHMALLKLKAADYVDMITKGVF
jgi:hypothetical protein